MATSKPIGWGDVDAQQIERQRRIAEQLMQTKAPEGQMISGRYVAPNFLSQLSAGLSGYVGDKINEKADQQSKELASQRGTALANALSQFGQDIQGTPAREVAPLTPNDDDGNVNPAIQMPAQPGNSGTAYAGLMKSGIPELQSMGMQGTIEDAKAQAGLARQQAMAKLLQSSKTPQEAIAAGIPLEQVKTYFDPGLGKAKGVAVNGQIVDPYSGSAIGSAIPKQADAPNFGTNLVVPGPDGSMVPNSALIDARKQIAKSGASSLNVDARNFNTQETEQSKAYGKQLGEMRGVITQSGFDAPRKIAQIDRMEQLLGGLDAGGKAAPTLADIGSFAQSLGVKLDPNIGVKEASQALAMKMASEMRAPGTGPMTDKDFDNFVKQVPDLSKTPEGRKQIATTMRAALQRDMEASKFARQYAKENGGVIDDNFYDAMANFYQKNPVVTPTMPSVNARGNAFGDPGKEQRYQEWLKSRGQK